MINLQPQNERNSTDTNQASRRQNFRVDDIRLRIRLHEQEKKNAHRACRISKVMDHLQGTFLPFVYNALHDSSRSRPLPGNYIHTYKPLGD